MVLKVLFQISKRDRCLKSVTNQILPVFLVFCTMLTIVKNVCAFNQKCDEKCLNLMCEYDPSTNSYYNSSISNTSPGYHGQGCCTGCRYPQAFDHYYDAAAKSCSQGSCPKDINGVQQYWFRDNTCQYDCSMEGLLYMNPSSGACEYNCSNGYYNFHITKICVSDCPSGFYKYITYKYEHICVTRAQCGSSYNSFTNDVTKKCEDYCSHGLYADQATFSCLNSCSEGYYRYISNHTVNYETKIWNICINKTRCNKQGPQGFVNNETQFCEFNCSGGKFANRLSGYCVEDCSNGTYKLYEYNGNFCVQNCSSVYRILDTATNSCKHQEYNNSTSSTKFYTIVLSQTELIIVGVSVFVVLVIILFLACWICKLQRKNRIQNHMNLANFSRQIINIQSIDNRYQIK